MSKRAEFKLHSFHGSVVGVGDVYGFTALGSIHITTTGDGGQSSSTAMVSPEVMRALAADLTLAAALVEENIERKKNAA